MDTNGTEESLPRYPYFRGYKVSSFLREWFSGLYVCVCVDSQYWCAVERCPATAATGLPLGLHGSPGGRREGETVPGALRQSGGEEEIAVQETAGGDLAG